MAPSACPERRHHQRTIPKPAVNRLRLRPREVLKSVRSAGPFPAAPQAIHSSDGRVYVRWVLHRDPEKACSVYYARPYVLEVPASGAGSDLGG